MEHNVIETAQATESLARVSLPAEDLWRAAKLLSGKVIERRGAIPILSNVMIETDSDGLVTLTGTDCEIFAAITLQASSCSECEPGRFTANASVLADALAKARKESEFITLEQEESRVILKAGRARLKFPTLPADDFPPTPTVGIDAPTDGISGSRFYADLKALSPAMSNQESRYHLQGVALQRRELAGRDRLCMVATDGSQMAVASRPLPAGLAAMPDVILPGKAVAIALAAEKLASAAPTLSVESGKVAICLGNVQIVAKTIDATYPDWGRAFEGIATPTADSSPPMFPELLPGRNVVQMAKLEKAFPGSIDWIEGNDGCIGSCATDPGLAWCVTNTALHYTGKKGFEHKVSDNGAEQYLIALAEQAGLPSVADFEARCEAINAEYGEPDCAAYNGERAFARAEIAERYIGHRESPFQSGLVRKGGRILGLTVGAVIDRRPWRETVQDWETLTTRTIEHEGAIEAVEGSYSIVMPSDGPQPSVAPDHYVDCEDGRRYPIADNEKAIHLDAKQLRALIGDSIFDVLEFPGPDGKPRYVSQWLWDDGDSRFLCVQANGRTPKDGAPREYVTREEIEAALAGEAVAIEAAPTVETESEPVIAAATPTDEIEAPESAQERESERCPPDDALEAPQHAPEAVSGDPSPDCSRDPIADIHARLAELHELVAALSVAPERPKRTPAHERAIRRAWQMRRQLREIRAQTTLARDMAANNRRAAENMRDDRDKVQRQLEAALATAQDHLAMREALQVELRQAARDRDIWAERAATWEAKWKDAEQRAQAAQAENAQLWQEIEALTDPAAPAPVAPMILETLQDALEVECDMAECPDSELAQRLRAAIALASPPQAIAA